MQTSDTDLGITLCVITFALNKMEGQTSGLGDKNENV